MKNHWTLLPDKRYQTYAKGWLVPCTSVISTKYIHSHTRLCSHTAYHWLICDKQEQHLIKGLCCKFVPLSLWACLPSALRLTLQTSQQICFCYDECNSDVSEVLFYSGPLVKKFISFTLENIILYLSWEDSTCSVERPLYFAWKWLKSMEGFMSLFDKVSQPRKHWRLWTNKSPAKQNPIFRESLRYFLFTIFFFFLLLEWNYQPGRFTGPQTLRSAFYNDTEFLFTMYVYGVILSCRIWFLFLFTPIHSFYTWINHSELPI